MDFGGYHTGLAEKMSVVRATSDFAYPLLAPIGFVDDGHASGTAGTTWAGSSASLPRAAGWARALGSASGRCRRLNVDQLTTLANYVGMRDPAIMGAIAMGESSGNPTRSSATSGQSVGLWQVHTPSWPQFGFEKFKGPDYNAKARSTSSTRRG